MCHVPWSTTGLLWGLAAMLVSNWFTSSFVLVYPHENPSWNRQHVQNPVKSQRNLIESYLNFSLKYPQISPVSPLNHHVKLHLAKDTCQLRLWSLEVAAGDAIDHHLWALTNFDSGLESWILTHDEFQIWIHFRKSWYNHGIIQMLLWFLAIFSSPDFSYHHTNSF
jgi:hypothetical protein